MMSASDPDCRAGLRRSQQRRDGSSRVRAAIGVVDHPSFAVGYFDIADVERLAVGERRREVHVAADLHLQDRVEPHVVASKCTRRQASRDARLVECSPEQTTKATLEGLLHLRGVVTCSERGGQPAMVVAVRGHSGATLPRYAARRSASRSFALAIFDAYHFSVGS